MAAFWRLCRLRFSLRTLLIVVALVGLWLSSRLNWIRQRHEFLAEHGLVSIAGPCKMAAAPFTLRMFGERGVGCVDTITQFDYPRPNPDEILPREQQQMDRMLEAAQRLFPEAEVVSSVPFWKVDLEELATRKR